MPQFQNTEMALDFLVGCILAQATREGVELSSVEREMLAYSAEDESRFSALNAAFENETNGVEYEETVSSLIRNLLARNEADSTAWREAVTCLRESDYYLLVMIEMAKRPRAGDGRVRDRLKLLATAAAAVALLMVLIVLFSRR